ncbi:MAG: sporulation peptidase YabG [Bacilli bacterium]
MLKTGDLVTRNSHNNDVVFKIVRIIDNIAYLSGVNVRLCADSIIDDLTLIEEDRKIDDNDFYAKITNIRCFERSEFFYIPGKILHIDGDREYLNRCLEFYKKANVLAFGVYSPENQMAENIEKYLYDINPDIVVITGHDSSTKKNSKYFSDAVKICRKYQKDYDKLIIISGACQSEYEKLIKAGSNFASSPKKINIHALDPAIIALSLSLTDKNDDVDLFNLLSKTSCGKDGFGGVNTKGVMTTGYPR